MSDAPITDSFEKQVERTAAENKAKKGVDPDQDRDDEAFIAALAELPSLNYHQQRLGAARALGLPVSALDKLVRAAKASQSESRVRDVPVDVEIRREALPTLSR